MLRLAVLLYGLLCLIGAVVLVGVAHIGLWIALYLAVNGALISGGLLLERSQYRPRIDRTRGTWEPTNERIVDPKTGRITEVHYNPTTGERNYVESEETVTPPPPRSR